MVEALEERTVPSALQFTWAAGPGTNNLNWSKPANWSGGVLKHLVPRNGDRLVFAPLADNDSVKFSNNDLAGIALASIKFTASDYTITGSAFSLGSGGITDAGAPVIAENEIDNNITLAPGTVTLLVSQHAEVLNLVGHVSGAGTLLKTGTGGLVLHDNSNLTGGVTARAGILYLQSTTALGAATAVASIGKDATTYFNFNGTVNNRLQLAGWIQGITGSPVTLSRAVTLTGPVTLTNQFTFSGMVNGPGSFDVLAGGDLALANHNRYTGGTKIENLGVVEVQANDGLGVGTATTEVFPQGLLELEGNNPASAIRVDQHLILHQDATTPATGVFQNVYGTNVWKGPIQLVGPIGTFEILSDSLTVQGVVFSTFGQG